MPCMKPGVGGNKLALTTRACHLPTMAFWHVGTGTVPGKSQGQQARARALRSHCKFGVPDAIKCLSSKMSSQQLGSTYCG